jgi:hypothetical protein
MTASAAKRLLRCEAVAGNRVIIRSVRRRRIVYPNGQTESAPTGSYTQMRLLKRDDHEWSQERLSHYVEGDLSRRARRRLELHAEDCPDCSRGIRAVRALLRLMHGAADRSGVRAPESIYDRVRAAANEGEAGAGPVREE